MDEDLWKRLDACRDAPGTKVVFSYEAILELLREVHNEAVEKCNIAVVNVRMRGMRDKRELAVADAIEDEIRALRAPTEGSGEP